MKFRRLAPSSDLSKYADQVRSGILTSYWLTREVVRGNFPHIRVRKAESAEAAAVPHRWRGCQLRNCWCKGSQDGVLCENDARSEHPASFLPRGRRQVGKLRL